MTDVYQWRRALHIPLLVILQILFIILFACFVDYDPQSAIGPPDPPKLSELNSKGYNITAYEGHLENPDEEVYVANLFEAEFLSAVKETKDPSSTKETIHQKISLLKSSIVRLIKDYQHVKVESNQEHGTHAGASELISNVYPCKKYLKLIIS